SGQQHVARREPPPIVPPGQKTIIKYWPQKPGYTAGFSRYASGDYIFYYGSGYISQPVAPSKVFKYKAFMIQAHKMQNRCMEIIYMYRILNDIISEFISLTINSRFDPPTCHPDGKAARVMIPSIIVPLQRSLAIIGS